MSTSSTTVNESIPLPEMLYTMSRDGTIEGVTRLIDSGIDVDLISTKYPKTACWIATYRRNNNILRMLLEHGADPNFETLEGVAPLYFAIAFQNLEAVKLLVDHGASLTSRDKKGHRPLYYAKNNECEEIIAYVTPSQN